MKKMVILRRLSQVFFFLLFIYVLCSTTYPLTGMIKPDTIFKADLFIMSMVSISERVVLPGLGIAVVMVLIALVIGRYFCGWICPLGSAIDITASIKRRRAILPDGFNAAARKLKFIFLGLSFILAVFGLQAAWLLDPIVIAARFVSLNMIPAITYLFNALFIFLIRDLNLQGTVKDVYYALKPTILGVKVFYFSHSLIIFSVFAVICAVSLIVPRLWCRYICPLGAVYSLAGRFAPLKRRVSGCVSCGRCLNTCRTGAIRKDFSYAQGECILCMDCVYECPSRLTKFSFSKDASQPASSDGGRKNFIILLFASFFSIGASFGRRKRAGHYGGGVIRPPAALEEEDFIDRCIRCGNCMKVCITNGLQPVMLQTDIAGIWTPQLVPETGYCEYQCTLCGRTCPTGAIPPLDKEQKVKVKLGVAKIDPAICLPWAKNEECIVCQEHCPVPDKAIKLNTYAGGPAKPYIDEELCVGCGICQNKCPVRPLRAVRVIPKNADRTKV